MAANAYTECKQVIGSIRAATAFLREIPAAEEASSDQLRILDAPPADEAGEAGAGESPPRDAAAGS
jgi:hypothetical protein